jgi:hypothetical protein
MFVRNIRGGIPHEIPNYRSLTPLAGDTTGRTVPIRLMLSTFDDAEGVVDVILSPFSQ